MQQDRPWQRTTLPSDRKHPSQMQTSPPSPSSLGKTGIVQRDHRKRTGTRRSDSWKRTPMFGSNDLEWVTSETEALSSLVHPRFVNRRREAVHSVDVHD